MFFLHCELSEEVDQEMWENKERVEDRSKRSEQVRERHRDGDVQKEKLQTKQERHSEFKTQRTCISTEILHSPVFHT